MTYVCPICKQTPMLVWEDTNVAEPPTHVFCENCEIKIG